jgi:hypothetical protein
MKFDPIERLNLAIAAGGVAGSLALASPAFASSLALGAGFGALNFRALRSASERLFSGELAGSGPWVALFSLRFVMLAGAIGFALHAGADPVALVMGLSAIVPAAVLGAWLMRPVVDPGAPALEADDPDWERWNAWLAREIEPQDEDEA